MEEGYTTCFSGSAIIRSLQVHDPNTVLRWLLEAAEQLRAFASYFLCEMHIKQVQLDELYAVLRAVKDGELGEDDAIKRLERSLTGRGRQWTLKVNCLWSSMSGLAPWRWRSVWCIRSPSG